MFLDYHTHKVDKNLHHILNKEANFESEDVYFSYGNTPNKTTKLKEELFLQSKCLALGECGLDKTIEISLTLQIESLEKQIALSEKHELPLILHCVKAWNEILILRRKLKPTQIWIYHGFRKTTILESVLAEGLLIGIGPAILFDHKLQKALLEIPLDKILLETDNQTVYSIEQIYEKVAELKKISLQELQEIILQNFKVVFKKWQIG